MALIPDDVHNFYEDLLLQHIQALELHQTRDEVTVHRDCVDNNNSCGIG